MSIPTTKKMRELFNEIRQWPSFWFCFGSVYGSVIVWWLS